MTKTLTLAESNALFDHKVDTVEDALYSLKNMPEIYDDEIQTIDNFLGLSSEFKVALYDAVIRGSKA